jgi:cardiolipin synthase
LTSAPASEATVDRFFTVSNILSISRALLVIPFVMVMLSDIPSSRFWGAAIMALAALTDKLDGVFARKLGEVTEWGKILDPLADKVGLAAAVLVLLYLGDVPLWFVGVVLARDILIFAGGMYVKSSKRVVLPSNETGKWAVGIITLTLFLLLIGLKSIVTDILLAVSTLMLAVSFALYLLRFVRVLKESA